MQRFFILFFVIPLFCFSLQSCQHKKSKQGAAVVTNDPLINEQLGKLFLAKNKLKSGVINTASNLQFYIVRTGVSEHPHRNDLVTVFYQGRFIDGKVFDAQHFQANPATFRVSSVIPGLQQALLMMQPGSIWVIYVPSDLAYGQKGIPGIIPPNATLVYTINLIGYKKG